MMGSMLKDCLKTTLSPSFLLCVVLHGLLKMNREGGDMSEFVWAAHLEQFPGVFHPKLD